MHPAGPLARARDRPPIPNRDIPLKEILGQKTEIIPLKDAIGRISTNIVGAYPPGTPLLLPGDIIDSDSMDWLNKTRDMGGELFGCDDNIEVVK